MRLCSFLRPVGAAVLAAALSACAQTFTFSTGFDYSVGDYGEDRDTKTLYVPFTGKWETGSWTLSATVPFIRVSGPGNVIRDIGLVGIIPRPTDATESGLGDVVLGATYAAVTDQQSGLYVDLGGKVKLGTASDTKGLGTGQNDFSFQVDVARSIGSWMPFATLGYRVLGDPTGIDLRNVLFGTVGASYAFDPSLNAGASLDLRDKTTAAGDSLAEMSVFVVSRLDDAWRIQGYLVKGFTDGSADYGFGAVISRRF